MEYKNYADVSVCMGLWWKGGAFQKHQKKEKEREFFYTQTAQGSS